MKRIAIVITLALPVPLYAATNAVLEGYRTAAQQEAPGFKDFSATRGEASYQLKTGTVACATCHGASPKEIGKHATTSSNVELNITALCGDVSYVQKQFVIGV